MIKKVLKKIVPSPWSVKYTKSVQNSYSNGTVTDGSLEGKVVCISGATGDIGNALLRRFLTEKCRVILIGRSEEKLKALCNQFSEKIDYLIMDLSIPEEIEKKYSEFLDSQKVDVLINNAGIFRGNKEKVFRNVSLDTWMTTMNTNLKSAELLSNMTIAAKDGNVTIINISSICSQFNSFRYSPYGLSKAALQGLTKDLNQKYGDKGVVARAILPGSVATKMGNIKLGDNIAGNNNILNRPALPEEIAALAAVYASDIGKYCVNNLIASAGERL
ncbi:MAG: SDR family oxidoreductase [Agathobacter sp.]|nr:SDR family oxidoreductase [Agathobacter sp.]